MTPPEIRPETSAPLLGEPLPVELMNTIWADRDGVHEALQSPADAGAWLRAAVARDDVVAPKLTKWLDSASAGQLLSVHRDLRALRDAARRLAARRTDDARGSALMPVGATAAVRTLNDLAATAQAWPVLSWTDDGAPQSTRDSDSAPGAVFVADLARDTIALLAGEHSQNLRACQAPGCVLYFVKQHPRREWCSAGCGNRARQARHYRRHHSDN